MLTDTIYLFMTNIQEKTVKFFDRMVFCIGNHTVWSSIRN